MNFSIAHIARALEADYSGNHPDFVPDAISIDSRSLQNNKATLFFALRGVNYDAHDYIEEMIFKGVSTFVVEKIPDHSKGKADFLIVKNTLEALQNLAALHRKEYTFPVVGITGSNGKTIVKEWLNFLLSPDYNIIRSPKSYNSQVGVPLSILAINENHNFGLFEVGISTVREMENLEQVVRPTIGILTNIGTAHDEGFANVEEKIREKMRLFENSDIVICQKNNTVDLIADSKIKLFTWSFDKSDADVRISKQNFEQEQTIITSSFSDNEIAVEIPFRDSASVENAISCLMVLLYLKYDQTIIQNRMKNLFPVEMRLKVKNGINNTTIIDDSYSSDFQSLKIALDFLESQTQHHRKTVILSDIFQSGLINDELYEKVAQLIVANKISRVIGIGETISKYRSKFQNGVLFKNTSEFLAAYDAIDFSNETILIKGARQFKFEDIVTRLEQKTHETILEINLNSISHNLSYYKSKLKPQTKLMVMVKAFGYGNGGFEIAKLLEHHKTDYLGVAFADEGISLRQAGIKTPIMVLNPESTSYPAIIKFDLEPEIYSLRGLKAFVKTAALANLKEYPIHIKIDTGMHRLGFDKSMFTELIPILKSSPSVKVKSILSHMATSDDLIFKDFALSQIALFEELSSYLMKELNINPIRHLLNTSGISNYPQAQYDMVRLGIGIYGISNDPNEQKFLENVGTLKSVISQLRSIGKGESVGYGRRFVAEKPTVIATIPIGYADGISRHWGNGAGFVTINNQKAPIVGSVCMDMLMADCTDIECQEGDPVIIFGSSPSVSYMASVLETIPYEILTSISQRVQRVFYRE